MTGTERRLAVRLFITFVMYRVAQKYLTFDIQHVASRVKATSAPPCVTLDGVIYQKTAIVVFTILRT